MNEPRRRTAVAVAFALYAVCIVLAIVRAYPRLLTRSDPHDYGVRPDRPPLHAPVHGPAHVDPSAATTFEYRLNAARTGISDEPFQPVTTIPAWTFGPLDVGIHDASKASPAVDASGVYVGADSSWFYALDLAGKLRWKLRVGSAARGIHGTAALDAESVFIGAYNGTLYALRKRDGELAWALRLGDTIGSSPVIVGDSLYVAVETFTPPDGFVARVRRATGEIVWLSEWLGEQSHSSPTIDAANGLVLVGSNNALYRALRLDSGAEVWRLPTRGAVKDTGSEIDGVVYVSSLAGEVYAIRAGDGHVLWHTALPGHSRSSPTDAGGMLIVGSDDGSVLGIDAATGAIAWRTATGFDNMIGSAVALRAADETWMTWMACSATALCALRASTGEIVQRLELGASITSVPTVFHGSLFLAADLLGGLLRFDPAD